MKAKLSAVAAITLVGFCLLMVGCGGDEVTSPSENEAPILAPQNVSVSLNAYGDVIVRWDPNTQPHLRGYNVYRLDVVGSTIATLTATPISDHFLVDDRALSDRDYEYRVTSVSARGSESAYSGIEIHVQTPSGTGPKTRLPH